MIVAIRLTRKGCRNLPSYKIVAADKRMPRDGRYIAELGHYSPLYDKSDNRYFKIDQSKYEYFLSKGAQVSNTIQRLVKKHKA